MTGEHLLPSNRSGWETAMSTVSAERRALPAEIVASVWNPNTCPVDLLGRLANGLSVDVWDDAWPETKKRQVCRDAFKLHRLKTTPAGIKAHVALTGAEVKRVIRPPASGFLYAAMTDDQRKAWLDAMPQIRLYPFFHRSIAKSRQFHSAINRRQFHGVGHLRKSRGRNLLGRRATYFDQGVETEIIYEASDGEAFERVYITGRRARLWHGRGYAGTGFLTASKAGENVVTVRLDHSIGFAAIGRGATPITVRPQRVAEGRIAPAARSFFGRFHSYPTGRDSGGLETEPGSTLEGVGLGLNVGKRFMKTSHAPLMIYDRISLHDPSRIGARRKTRSFHGHGRFGIADFTAELRIHVPMMRHRRRSGQWHKAGYRKAANMAPLHKAIEAVRVSKAFRDTVLIDTATFGPVKFSGALQFGAFTFGEIKEVA